MSSRSLTSAATTATTSSSSTLTSSSEDLINQMEETLIHNSCTKVKPQHSKSFHEGNTTPLEYVDEDLTSKVKQKFKKAKNYVNLDLVNFTQNLREMVEKTKEYDPEMIISMENILRIAEECKKMSTDEFWYKCESIVQELDDRRKELAVNNALKHAYTNLLFVLTRCTRLVQVLKEDQSNNQQFWFLNAQNFRGR